jgi:hypothetical protein
MKVKDLKPNPMNPRKITEQKLWMLRKSMEEFGDLSGIVFNRRSGQIIGGHQRLKHLDPDWEIVKKKTEDSVGTVAIGHIITPKGNWTYREVDWPQEKEIAANIAANQHGGEFDILSLKTLTLQTKDFDLIGFDPQELENLLGKKQGRGNESELVPPKDPNVLARISFHPGIWLGKREEIQKIFESMERTYSCRVAIDE